MKVKFKKITFLMILVSIFFLICGCSNAKEESEYAEEFVYRQESFAGNISKIIEKLNSEDTDLKNEEDVKYILNLIDKARNDCLKIKGLKAPEKYKEAQKKFIEACDTYIEGLDIITECMDNPESSDFASELIRAADIFSKADTLMNEGSGLIDNE